MFGWQCNPYTLILLSSLYTKMHGEIIYINHSVPVVYESTCSASRIASNPGFPPKRLTSSLAWASKVRRTERVYSKDCVWCSRYEIAYVFKDGVLGRFWSTSNPTLEGRGE